MKKALLASVLAFGTMVSAHAKDLVDTAVSAGSFKTLVTAVQAAGLVDTLKGTGPFTVFAPTDEAFAKIPKAQLDALLKDKAALTKVINGPIPYTPDGNPLIGPMPGVPNAFEACVFTFGICQAGGAGKCFQSATCPHPAHGVRITHTRMDAAFISFTTQKSCNRACQAVAHCALHIPGQRQRHLVSEDHQFGT